jgi:hypothetical protein
MTRAEALKLSGRSETWLRRHECVWCSQTLWRALRFGCGAMFNRCRPEEKDFSNYRVERKPFAQTQEQHR